MGGQKVRLGEWWGGGSRERKRHIGCVGIGEGAGRPFPDERQPLGPSSFQEQEPFRSRPQESTQLASPALLDSGLCKADL